MLCSIFEVNKAIQSSKVAIFMSVEYNCYEKSHLLCLSFSSIFLDRSHCLTFPSPDPAVDRRPTPNLNKPMPNEVQVLLLGKEKIQRIIATFFTTKTLLNVQSEKELTISNNNLIAQ
jgi:hypothetical protein